MPGFIFLFPARLSHLDLTCEHQVITHSYHWLSAQREWMVPSVKCWLEHHHSYWNLVSSDSCKQYVWYLLWISRVLKSKQDNNTALLVSLSQSPNRHLAPETPSLEFIKSSNHNGILQELTFVVLCECRDSKTIAKAGDEVSHIL